jgi:hypothetical protein
LLISARRPLPEAYGSISLRCFLRSSIKYQLTIAKLPLAKREAELATLMLVGPTDGVVDSDELFFIAHWNPIFHVRRRVLFST